MDGAAGQVRVIAGLGDTGNAIWSSEIFAASLKLE